MFYKYMALTLVICSGNSTMLDYKMTCSYILIERNYAHCNPVPTYNHENAKYPHTEQVLHYFGLRIHMSGLNAIAVV
jgi:hypothetical protein